MTKENSLLVELIEKNFGQIKMGWKSKKLSRLNVISLKDDKQKVNYLMTLGLSHKKFQTKQDREVKAEYFMEFSQSWSSREAASLLLQLAENTVLQNDLPNPEETISVSGGVWEDDKIHSIYFTSPYLRDHFFQNDMDKVGVVIIWALPITKFEHEFLKKEGRVKLEDYWIRKKVNLHNPSRAHSDMPSNNLLPLKNNIGTKITDFTDIEPYEGLNVGANFSGFELIRDGSYTVQTIIGDKVATLDFEPISCMNNFSKKRRFKVFGETEYTFIDEAIGVHEFIEKVLALTDAETEKKFRTFFYDYTPEQAEENFKTKSKFWDFDSVSAGKGMRFNFSKNTKPSRTDISKVFVKKSLSKQVDIKPYSFHLFTGRDVDSFSAKNKIFNLYLYAEDGDCFCLSHIDGKDNSPITDVFDYGDIIKLYHWRGFSTHLDKSSLLFLKQEFTK